MATPTPTTAQIYRLRRMVAEPTDATYMDSDLSATLSQYPLNDGAGLEPDDVLWAGVWDLNRAAADIWTEKAAAVAANFDFQADGGNYTRSQVHTQYAALAKSFMAKRSAGSVELIATPKPLGAVRLESWRGNLSELATESDYE